MEKLLKQIMEILQMRSQQQATISLKDLEQQIDSVHLFLYNQSILLTNVDVVFLKEIISEAELSERTKWFLKGYDYGCEYQLQLSFEAYQLIPQKIFEWPVKLIAKNGNEIHVIDKKVISYQDIGSLPEKAILIKNKCQILTWLAAELIDNKKIKLIER